MSGSFGLGALISAGLNLPEQLIFGSPDPLVLGTVVFDSFEIPEQINFGGTQGLHVHRLPGGERVFDVMGREEDPISWSGVFLGRPALARAQALDVMRGLGATVQLSWGSLSYTVVVKSFQADYRFAYNISYKISCEVLRDNSAPLPNNTVTPEQAVSNDVGSGNAAMPPDAPSKAVVNTVAETGPGTTTTQTFAPVGTQPADLGLDSTTAPATGFNNFDINQGATAGNNLGNSSVDLVNPGQPFQIPSGTDSVTAATNAQSSADAFSTANAPLFTGQ